MTAAAKQARPTKPYADFPLYAHGSGQWARKTRKRNHYFGPCAKPTAALERYLAERDYLYGGECKRDRTNAPHAVVSEEFGGGIDYDIQQ